MKGFLNLALTLTLRQIIILSFFFLFSEFHALKDYITQAEESQFPECDLLDQLRNHIIEAEQCSQVANQLLTKKHKTRYNFEI